MNKVRTNNIGLKSARMHEVSGGAALAFALIAAGAGDIVLCGRPVWLRSIHPDGVRALRDPARVLQVACPLKADALWAVESALRSAAVSAVFLSMFSTPGLTEFRRLQLAAEEGNTLGIVLSEQPATTSPAETRWLCQYNWQEGVKCIRASLYKNKSGVEGSWNIHVERYTDPLGLVASPVGESVRPDRHTG